MVTVRFLLQVLKVTTFVRLKVTDLYKVFATLEARREMPDELTFAETTGTVKRYRKKIAIS